MADSKRKDELERVIWKIDFSFILQEISIPVIIWITIRIALLTNGKWSIIETGIIKVLEIVKNRWFNEF